MKNLIFTNLAKSLLAGLLIAGIFNGCQKGADDLAQNIPSPSVGTAAGAAAANHVPNELLVKFKEGTSAAAKSQALARVNGTVAEIILTNAMKRANQKEGIQVVRMSMNALDAISRISGAETEYAEPNYVYNHFATSNDTYFTNGSLWGGHGCSFQRLWLCSQHCLGG